MISDEEVTCYLRPLHELVMKGSNEFGKEENLLLLISLLIQQYGQPFENCVPECREVVPWVEQKNIAPCDGVLLIFAGQDTFPVLHEANHIVFMEMVRKRLYDALKTLLLLISLLIQQYGQPFENCVPECREEIERACAFMEQHYTQRIYLDQICRCAGLSKSTLLRAFARSKGVTPYSYLENIRIGKAKKLLERGVSPIDAALQTGFSDQSHFSNYFNRFIGLAPGVYRDIFRDTEEMPHEG